MELMIAKVLAQISLMYAPKGTQVNIADYLPPWLKLKDRDVMTVEQINRRNFEAMCGMCGISPAEVIRKAKVVESEKKGV